MSSNPRIDTQPNGQSGLKERIKILERILEDEVADKAALERELYDIEDSLAWRLVMSYRRIRNTLLGENTRRRKMYEIIRNMLRQIVLLSDRKSRVTLQELPYLMNRLLQSLKSEGLNGAAQRVRNRIEIGYEYARWMEKYDKLTDDDRIAIKRQIDGLSYRPLLSIVMPTFNTPEKWLRLAIDSVRAQLYPNWELCIADDASSDPNVKYLLERYGAEDPRIKVRFREARGHISAASNSALEIAEGDFVALLDHDDELREHALYMVAMELNAHPDADLIYSDEDKIDEQGTRYAPYFKPDWNPVLFFAQNFVCHLAVFRTRMLREIGGFHLGYEGAQDWDLVMRVTEQTPASHIRHIPHVLYHWRAIAGSTAKGENEKKYALDAQRRTLQVHFKRSDETVLSLVRELLVPQYQNIISCKVGDKLQFIKTPEILYFKSDNRSTFLFTSTGKKFIVDAPLIEMEKRVNPKEFIRIRRGTIVNLAWISEIRRTYNGRLKVILMDKQGTELEVSRGYVDALKAF